MKRNINFKHTSLFALLCLLFMQMLASCDGEKQGRRIKLNFPSTAYLSSPHSIPLSVVLG